MPLRLIRLDFLSNVGHTGGSMAGRKTKRRNLNGHADGKNESLSVRVGDIDLRNPQDTLFIYLFIYLATHKTLYNMNKRC